MILTRIEKFTNILRGKSDINTTNGTKENTNIEGIEIVLDHHHTLPTFLGLDLDHMIEKGPNDRTGEMTDRVDVEKVEVVAGVHLVKGRGRVDLMKIEVAAGVDLVNGRMKSLPI